ncbi:hypothetical protein MTO96_033082 [Rhipicephalus appendiculatus]
MRDATKLVKHQIIDGRSRNRNDLLGLLYLEKTCDSVFHNLIVKTILDLSLGSRFHSYGKLFANGQEGQPSHWRLPLRRGASRRTGLSW